MCRRNGEEVPGSLLEECLLTTAGQGAVSCRDNRRTCEVAAAAAAAVQQRIRERL